MKIFKKVSIVVFIVAFAFGLKGPTPAHAAAVAPVLGAAASFSVLADLSTSSAVSTTTSGDLGLSTGLAGSRTGVWVVGGTEYFGPLSLAATAQTDAGLANISMAGQASDGAWGPIGLTPGVYTSAASPVFAGTLTLTGGPTDVWVFQLTTDFTFTGDVVLAGGAQACNVYWQIGRDATINGPGTFVGTLIAGRDISVVGAVTVDGRLLAARTLTTGGVTSIVNPACVVPPPPAIQGGGPQLYPVPPLINVTKIPTPLSLPLGPGPVTYDYTVLNVGTVAMNNVTVTDNKCSAVVYVSGDTNLNSNLDVTETWKYRCTMTLPQTETNTVTASGQANGFTVFDTANATVVVGIPLVPPLIHIVKIPNIFLLSAGGGAVTYNYTVTNPGTAPLNNVSVVDDKCTGLPGRVVGHPGDLNQNNLLESNEAWSFTCQTNLTQTTTNIGTAEGSANGLTITDFSPATVVVALPALPQTGASNALWSVIIPAGVLVALFSFYLARKKRALEVKS